MKPLHSFEAEQSVLGALLLNNDAIDYVADLLTAGDFYSAAHRRIYAAIAALLADGKRADVVTLRAVLERSDDLAAVGGLEYLGQLLEAVPTSKGVANYARIVRDRRLERDLHAAGQRLVELASDARPIAERLDQAQAVVLALSETAVSGEAPTIGELLPALIERIEKRQQDDATLPGISTGLHDLDARLGGLHAGQLIVIAGRPGMGKSVLGAQIAEHLAIVDGHATAIFSLEMDRDELTERALVRAAKLDADRVRTGKLQRAEDWDALTMAVGKLHHAPIRIDDSAGATVGQIRAKARRLARQHGLRLVVVDYLQLMDGEGESRAEQVSTLSRGLKLLAKELRVPVIALSQLNRKCEERTNKRPQLSDLREGGSIEQDADVVIFLYRDEVYDELTQAKGVVELNIAKQRMGRTGTVYASWIGEHYLIADRTTAFVPPPPPGERRGRNRHEGF
jgi:replicative DNA helicase